MPRGVQEQCPTRKLRFRSSANKNAIKFLLGLSSKCDPVHRALIVKKFLDPKSSNPANAEFFSMLVTCAPELVTSLDPATKLRVRALLLANAKTIGVRQPYAELRQPAHVLGASIRALGEATVIAELSELLDWVVNAAPYSPEFIETLGKGRPFGRRCSTSILRTLARPISTSQIASRPPHRRWTRRLLPRFPTSKPLNSSLPLFARLSTMRGQRSA